jgi:hypothetical protein
MYVQDGGF